MFVDGFGYCVLCYLLLNVIGGEQCGCVFDGGIVDGWEVLLFNVFGQVVWLWMQVQFVIYLCIGCVSEYGVVVGLMLLVMCDFVMVLVEDVEVIVIYILLIQKLVYVCVVVVVNVVECVVMMLVV